MKKDKLSIIDDVFDLEPLSSIHEHNIENLPSINISYDEYDDKDSEIEDQFQFIYDKAIEAFNTQMSEAEDIEGKYLARNTEVANQLLNTALNAVKEKFNLKKHSDDLKLKKNSREGHSTNITNNNLIMDRNDILKMLKNEN